MVGNQMEMQYVCTVCGYDMVGYHPSICPFCGASQTKFITAEECSARFRVSVTPVTDRVDRLSSVPALGYEHAAYRLATDDGDIWIDCPSCFDTRLKPVRCITFTHHHFLGASNLYRRHFSTRLRIHEDDASHRICRGFIFDQTFWEDFSENGLEAYHVDGHTPGFTFYIFEDSLFLCDYVFYNQRSMRLNPFGPEEETETAARRLQKMIASRKISRVCGYNYVADYPEWARAFGGLLDSVRPRILA